MSSWFSSWKTPAAGAFAERRKRFLRGVWLVMALIGCAIIFVEVSDHAPEFAAGGGNGLLQDVELLREIIMFGIGIPLVGGILLSLLSWTLVEREQAVRVIDRQRTFSEGLLEAVSWEERAARIARFPGEMVSALRSSLTLFDQGTQVAATWVAEGAGAQQAPVAVYERCRACYAEVEGDGLRLCAPGQQESAASAYCLPLSRGGALLGVLNFELKAGQDLNPWQRHTLVDAAPAISQAIEVMRLESSLSSNAEAVASERQRIGRNLHDTLAQNIVFLRLKLDELSTDAPLREIAALQQEIERMRQVADEAYTQVRETLLTFREEEPCALAPAVEKLVQGVRSRTQLEIALVVEGQTAGLTPAVQHNVLFICREALTNVEKHAAASQATVRVAASATRLTVHIQDDGRGFDPERVDWVRSFGLGIMYERAEAVGGMLAIQSGEGQGTSVQLSIPLGESGAERGQILATAEGDLHGCQG